jgi:hypothetical protein
VGAHIEVSEILSLTKEDPPSLKLRRTRSNIIIIKNALAIVSRDGVAQ